MFAFNKFLSSMSGPLLCLTSANTYTIKKLLYFLNCLRAQIPTFQVTDFKLQWHFSVIWQSNY